MFHNQTQNPKMKKITFDLKLEEDEIMFNNQTNTFYRHKKTLKQIRCNDPSSRI